MMKSEVCYVGVSNPVQSSQWILQENGELKYQSTHNIPKIIKMFQEIFSNAVDSTLRVKKESTWPSPIKVKVTSNSIKITNYGHKPLISLSKYKPTGDHDSHLSDTLIPAVVFGELYSSSNFDTSEGIGKFGIGAKVVNMFSEHFKLVVKSHTETYTHIWKRNETVSSVVKKSTNPQHSVSVEFTPLIDDKPYNFTQDEVMTFKKLTLDSAIFIENGIQFNSTLLQIKAKDYFTCHVSQEPSLIFNDNHSQVFIFFKKNIKGASMLYANGCAFKLTKNHTKSLTSQLASHANLTDEIIREHILYFILRKKSELSFDNFQKTAITNDLQIVFDKPTKDKFLASEVITWVTKINKSLLTKPNQIPQLTETLGKPKTSMIILTEGESAKANTLVGLSSLRTHFAIYSITGKPSNISGMPSHKYPESVLKLISILGENLERYKGIIIMTDPDPDGKHIAALLLDTLYEVYKDKLANTLIRIFNTPVIRVSKNNKTLKEFFDKKDFEISQYNTSKYLCQYFKGLASFTKDDMQIFFKDIEKYLIKIKVPFSPEDTNSLAICFETNKIAERKQWINKEPPHKQLTNEITTSDYINYHVRSFSIEDSSRSLPSFIDGLKLGQRKVVACCCNFHKKHKVTDLSALVSTHCNYHGGTTSIDKTIIEMSRDEFDNNLPLLKGHGAFGNVRSKIPGQARYLATEPTEVFSLLFPQEELKLLDPRVVDGKSGEPTYFIPPLPLVLLFGKKGIGTGWASKSIPFHPLSLIRFLQGECDYLVPHMRHNSLLFVLNAENIDNYLTTNKWKIKMVPQIYYNKKTERYLITSLPIDTTITQFLDFLLKNEIEYKDLSTDQVKIEVNTTLSTSDFINKLTVSFTPNLTFLDEDEKICTLTITEIITKHKTLRLAFNEKKRQHRIKVNTHLLLKKTNILRFLLSGKTFKNHNKKQAEKYLQENDFPMIDDSYNYITSLTFKQSCKDSCRELEEEITKIQEKIKSLQATNSLEMWNDDLTLLSDYFKNETQTPLYIPNKEWTDITKQIKYNDGKHFRYPMTIN